MATRRVEGKIRLDFFALRMSALGQEQTFAVHQPISTLPPKGDMCGATAHARFRPRSGSRRVLRQTHASNL
jgi:hypothetical protein